MMEISCYKQVYQTEVTKNPGASYFPSWCRNVESKDGRMCIYRDAKDIVDGNEPISKCSYLTREFCNSLHI